MLSSWVVSLQFSSPAKVVNLAVFSLRWFHRRGRSGSLLDGVCHLMRNLTTAWTLRPNGESLETLEKASCALKKAKSKTDGEVPALKRVGKVMPWNKCPISAHSSRWSKNDSVAEHERACQSIAGSLKSPNISVSPFFSCSRRDLGLRYTQRTFRVVLFIAIVYEIRSVRGVPSCLSWICCLGRREDFISRRAPPPLPSLSLRKMW